MGHWKVYLFGPPRIERDGLPVEISSRKSVALFIYLIVTQQSFGRESLATLFWPDADQETALGNFRRALYRLNQATGGELLEITRKTTGLHPQASIWVDTIQFQQTIEECFPDLSASLALQDDSQRNEAVDCLARLEAAVEYYQDGFLAGFSISGSPSFDEWLFFTGDHYRQQYEKLLARLVSLFEEQVNWDKGIAAARRWLASDPLNETAHRVLMRLYALAGQNHAALRQFDQCERILQQELHIRPEKETYSLYEQIKNRQLPSHGEAALPDHELPRARNTPIFPIDPQAQRNLVPGPPHNLPAQPYPFFGRKKELSDLRDILTENRGSRLVSITGPGGIGKTRLAIEATLSIHRTFTDGAYFIPLASHTSAAHIATTIAEQLGLRSYDGRPVEEHLLQVLRSKRLLLILDNFEHLLPGVGFINQMLAAAPDMKILVTSRERLNLSGELNYVLGSMTYPHDGASEVGDEEGALQLLVHCARMARPHIQIEASDRAELVRICRLVEGIPLATILAASWLKVLSFKDVADEIEQSLDFLSAQVVDVPERHTSMRAAFDYSWKRLSSADQQAFMCLSVFRGGFSRQAAHAVTGTTLSGIRNLIDKSFLTLQRDGLYEIHELLRQYALEKLEQTGQRDGLNLRHSRFYLELVRGVETDLKSSRLFTALEVIDDNLENIRAAWNWALQQLDESPLDLQDRRELALAVGQAAESLYLYFAFRSRYPEGTEFFSSAYDRLATCPDLFDWRACERVMARFAWLQVICNLAIDSVERNIESCLAQSTQAGDLVEEAFCDMLLGMVNFIVKHDPVEASTHYERALAAFETVGDRFYIACTLYYAGECQAEVTGLENMISMTQQSLEISREIENPALITFNLHNLARAAFLTGDYATSERYGLEALPVDREMGLSLGIADSRILLSLVQFLKGSLDQAIQLADEALEIARVIHYPAFISEALAIQSILSSVQGDVTVGKRLGRESLTGHASALGRILANWGLAFAFCGLGQDESAWRFILTALEEADRLSFPGLTPLLLPLVALLAARLEQLTRSVELLSQASRERQDLTGWWSTCALLVELQAHLQMSLGPSAYRAAWERGQARSERISTTDLLEMSKAASSSGPIQR